MQIVSQRAQLQFTQKSKKWIHLKNEIGPNLS